MSNSPFILDGYDLYSFDLDHTLCTYQLNNLYASQHESMTIYLAEEMKYEGINMEFSKDNIDFISRGLMIDFDKGNLLKVNMDGVVERANIGSRAMGIEEIATIYGETRTWKPIQHTMKNPILIQGKKALKHVAFITDFTNATASLVYVKAIDVALQTGRNIPRVWLDVFNSIMNMYTSGSKWVDQFRSNLDHFTNITDTNVKSWVLKLKSNAKTALITSSDAKTARLVAERCLGSDWKNLFNFIIYSANKPNFFTKSQTFYAPEGAAEVGKSSFKLDGEFTSGSFTEVEKVLKAELGRQPRAIYFGDSPINDLVCPAEAVSIIEESEAEKLIVTRDRTKDVLLSRQWGSLFYEGEVPSFFGNIVMQTKFCAPSLNYFTNKPTNFEYVPFWVKK